MIWDERRLQNNDRVNEAAETTLILVCAFMGTGREREVGLWASVGKVG